MIPPALYRQITDLLPILCVDVVLTNQEGETLLLRRANRPLRDQWWVVGGRVHKGETLAQAAVRKVREELSVNVGDLRPLGFYEDVFDEGTSDGPGSLHAVSVVFSASIDRDAAIILDDQSSAWKFSSTLPERFVVKPFQGTGEGSGDGVG